MLSKAVSSTIFYVFGMTRPGIDPRSPGPLANTLLISPIARYCLQPKQIIQLDVEAYTIYKFISDLSDLFKI